MSIMVAAADLGIGSGHASIGDQSLVRELLAIPEEREPAMLIALGSPADSTAHAGRSTRSAAVRRRGPSWSLVSE